MISIGYVISALLFTAVFTPRGGNVNNEETMVYSATADGGRRPQPPAGGETETHRAFREQLVEAARRYGIAHTLLMLLEAARGRERGVLTEARRDLMLGCGADAATVSKKQLGRHERLLRR
jgi:hypothetical protein